jgi:YVTN family beta-propeller protein
MVKMSSLLASLCCFATATILQAAPAPRYVLSAPIAGPDDGGWDYAHVDPATNRLFVARGTSVTLVELSGHYAARAIGMVDHGHAVVPLPGGKLLVTSGHDDSVRILDQQDGHELARIAVGSDPDAAFYDANSGRAVVMNAKAGSLSVIDPGTGKVSATIMIKPALEYGVMGPRGLMFVNDEDANEIEVVDLAKGKVMTPIAMPGCEGPSGLAYDARGDHLISACANGKASVVDAAKRHQIALLEIGKGPDAVILDEKRRLAFIPCGRDGILDVLSLDGANGVSVAAKVATEVGARTGTLDPRDGTLYLPTAKLGPPATPRGRPRPLPGTFHLVVVKRQG